MGRSCLQTILVSGKRRVPAPPARRMAFLFIRLFLVLRCLLAAPAHEQFRPFLPETCACGQTDPDFLPEQSGYFPRSGTESRLVEQEGTAPLSEQFPVTQASALASVQCAFDPILR